MFIDIWYSFMRWLNTGTVGESFTCPLYALVESLRSPPWLDWPLWNICVKNDYGYVSLVVSTSRSFPHSWLITGFVTRLPRRVPLEEQELFTLPKHRISPMGISRVRVTRSLVLCVCLVDRFLPFCNFFFSHCVVCSSLIYEF